MAQCNPTSAPERASCMDTPTEDTTPVFQIPPPLVSEDDELSLQSCRKTFRDKFRHGIHRLLSCFR
ncbi:hypothetical protein EX30DRAFT_342697 [Ascodesmis nigricans]|uniref:Uncharacterized protein n=1 Tax=Ascodesmis nigricans TaxID=341454 RepID=A0A4S2MRW9_9PEZI|nr:hypothetical protein EX30DRAFT_342697 [Ascodesmis nigricans]